MWKPGAVIDIQDVDLLIGQDVGGFQQSLSMVMLPS